MNFHNTADRPISEEYRIAAKQWVEADAAANMLEETKSAVLSQKMQALGDMAVNKAELSVKASTEWSDFISAMVLARKTANLMKVKLEYVRMRYGEWQSAEANSRAERKL